TGSGTSAGWDWANGTQGVERWGTNTISGVANNTPNGSMFTNTLLTTFDSTSGSDQAAVELDDSGGALFYKFGSSWFLSGITLYVSTAGASYYINDPVENGNPSVNAFGRIADYQSQITTAMTAVPEPGVISLLVLGGAALAVARGRRARRT